MRTIRLLAFSLLAALLLAMPSVGRCQYPAFTLAGLGTAPSASIVRTYTAPQLPPMISHRSAIVLFANNHK